MEPESITIAELQKQLAEKETELGRVSDELVGIKQEVAARRQVEELLRASDERFQLIVEQTHDVVYAIKPDGIITYLSQSFAHFGYSPDEAVSKNFIEFVAPEQRQRVIESFETGTKAGTNFPTIFQWLKKDGSRVWVEVVGNTVFDDTGNAVQQVGVIRDITERKNREEENRSLSILLDTTGAECFIKDINGTYLYINSAFEKQFRVRKDEVIGRDDAFVFGPETAALLRENDQRIMDVGKTVSIEESTWIKDIYVTYLTTKTPLFDEQNQVFGICGAGIDITEKKRLEDALVASEQMYRNLVDNISDALFTLEVDGAIKYISPAIEAILGYTPEEMTGLTAFDFIVPDEHDIARNRLGMLRAGESPRFGEYQALTKQGEKRWLRISSQPIEENGRITGIRGVMTDIHGRRTAAEQLEQAAVLAERERLARDLHDAVTQSLFMATATAEALPRVWEQNPEQAQQALKALQLLTRGALAEMRSLLLELRPASFSEQSLATLLRQLTDGLAARRRMIVTTTIVGECRLPDDIKMALYRITQEALNNVVKHSEAGQALVSLHCEDEQVLLRVTDNGKGFELENVAAHFGLENMQARVNDIGAELRINASPGNGTEIQVVWPQEKTTVSANAGQNQ